MAYAVLYDRAAAKDHALLVGALVAKAFSPDVDETRVVDVTVRAFDDDLAALDLDPTESEMPVASVTDLAAWAEAANQLMGGGDG